MESTQAFVFASPASVGNEAHVIVHSPGAIDQADMQRIARERAVPVTAFLEPAAPEWRVRFFTKQVELPYCGHGVLAAGRVALDRLGVDQTTLRAASQAVLIRREGGMVSALTTRAHELSLEPDAESVLACFHWAERGALGPVHRASIGSPKWLVRVPNLRTLHSLTVDGPRLAELSRDRAVNGAYVYTVATEAPGIDAEARAFNPASGSLEDSATGVGAGALAWLLREASPVQTRFVIRQGRTLGQDNHILVELAADGSTQVGGRVNLS
jgi:PhzF family phenazine biosynthesis protein